MVNKLKATLKLEDTLPAFLFAILSVHTPVSTFRNISAIFQIYRPFLHLYRRFFHYIDSSTQYIDLPTSFDTPKAQHTLSPKQLTTELHD